MTIEQLLNILLFPSEVEKEIKKNLKELDLEKLNPLIKALNDITIAKNQELILKEKLGEDPDGFKILTCYLVSSLNTYEMYKENNISDKVYIDTMMCFKRFVLDYYHRFNKYHFAEDWWTYRQTSMVLFRIGELEFEIDEKGHDLYLHFPTDAKVSKEDMINSLKAGKYFLNNHFPKTKDYKLKCESWLLSKEITEFLKPTSHILMIQSMFDIFAEDKDAQGFKQWLFDTTPDAKIETLKEDTSLRRGVKQKLLNGGYVGTATGVLKDEYWK